MQVNKANLSKYIPCGKAENSCPEIPHTSLAAAPSAPMTPPPPPPPPPPQFGIREVESHELKIRYG